MKIMEMKKPAGNKSALYNTQKIHESNGNYYFYLEITDNKFLYIIYILYVYLITLPIFFGEIQLKEFFSPTLSYILKWVYILENIWYNKLMP